MSEISTARPLVGKRIAITRPPEQAAALAERLEALGARTVPLATIAIAPIEDPTALDAAIARLASYDWLVFTSVNGVAAFAGRLAASGRDWDARGLARVAAIGPATARALEEHGVRVDLTPDEYVAEGILERLGNVAGQRLLLARADIARRALADGLRLRGAEVDEIAAYRTVIQPADPEMIRRALLDDERVDAITFTSSSTVRNFMAALEAAQPSGGPVPTRQDLLCLLSSAKIACIGPITSQTAAEYGLTVQIQAREYTIPGLVEAILESEKEAV